MTPSPLLRLFRIFSICLTTLIPIGLHAAQGSKGSQYRDPSGSSVTQQLRYHAPSASEVWLLWGINGWKAAPTELLPPGTTVYPDGKMMTPLVRSGDAFAGRLRVPPGATIDHGFLITKTADGTVVNLWEPHPPYAKVRQNGRIEIESTTTTVTPEQYAAWLAGKRSDIPLVAQQIRYHATGAGEAWLLWGVNGWHPVPESLRPPGTILTPDQVMHTPLVRQGNTFSTTIRIPPGTTIDHGFAITKTENGTAVTISETHRPYTAVRGEGRLEAEVPGISVTREQRKAWLGGQAQDLPLTTQQIRYRAPETTEVSLVWGIDDWQPIPPSSWPTGTTLEYGVMKTMMALDGDVFTATVKVPSGAMINYRFSTQGGDHKPGPFVARLDGLVEVTSAINKGAMEQQKIWPAGPLAELTLATQEIHYRIAGAEEVWLVWGINGWQTIPEAARPPGTVLKDNKLMQTRMVRKGDTFATTVRVPPETMLNYTFLITKTSRGVPVSIRQDFNGQDFWKLVRTSGSLEEKATVTVVTPEERKAWLSGQIADLPLVTQTIRYHAPGAAEVWFEWGLEGWQTIPEAARPSGTVLNNGRMQTHLVREGNTFTTTVRLPPGTQLDYGFLITKTEKGTTIDIRQEKDEHGQVFSKVVAFDDRIAVQSTAWLSIGATDLPLVAQEIRYRIAGAEEVWLVWGINGWQTIPEAARPPGTVLKDNKLMQTRMVRKGDTFATTIQVPKGTKLDYKFLITKTSRGTPVTIWQDNQGQAFGKLVRVNGSLEEYATVAVVTPEQRKAWLSGQIADLPLVTQTIRYHAPGAAEVWFEWGLEGWQTIPEAARPIGTALNDGRMHTAMARKGSTFTTTIQTPPGTVLDFLFRITRTEEGTPLAIRHENDEEGRILSKLLAFDGQIDIYSQWKRRP